MAAWLANAWGQVWPNIAADALWVPLAALHHVAMKRHITRMHARTQELIDSKEGP